MKFKGTFYVMSQPQQIQGRDGIITKATIYVAPTLYDTFGEPTVGNFEQSFPIEVLDAQLIQQLQGLPQGLQVEVNVSLRGRTKQQEDGSIKGFLSMTLQRIAFDNPQGVQQAQQQPTAAPPIGQAQPAPFNPLPRR